MRAALLVLALAVAPTLAWAQEPAERVALVVGNSSYKVAPLPNPRNDARSMSELLRRAGFTVDQRVDTSQQDLQAAIDQFGQLIRNPKVKFGLFYYAGHGLQQDWRNYLVPVTADIRKADDVRTQTVDVSHLLAYMDQAKGRSFLVILDACRDDPFAGAYRPSAKGLSQFDAPVGSLLAYATAPGNVALDGEGTNGLYTTSLLQEFAVPGLKLEDAFKRVRLAVRLASRGKQVPWESTSLEEDVYLFPTQRRKLSESEQEQQLEQEITAWVRVKSTNNIDQLAGFLREHPSGYVSELAQARLSRLMSAQALQQAQAEADRRSREQAAQQVALAAQRQAAEQQAAEQQAREQALAQAEAERKAREVSARLAEAQRLAREQEAARLVEVARQARDDEARRQAEAVRLAEGERAAREEAQRKVAQAQRHAREEAQRLAEAEQAARDAQTRRRAEAERVARDDEARRLAEAQRARVAAAEALEKARLDALREAEAARVAREAQQQRLAELQKQQREREEEARRAQAAAVTVTAPVAAPVAAAKPVEFAPTPYSTGYAEHERLYRIGDVHAFRVIDTLTRHERPLELKVTSVDVDGDRVEYNSGEYLSDLMGNVTTNTRGVFSSPRQFYPAELFVGKKWQTMFRQQRPNGVSYTFKYDVRVVARERVTVPAGTFDTYKIEARGFNIQLGAALSRNIWVSPGVPADIAHETLVRLRNNQIEQYDRQELVSLRPASATAQR